jgi:hypothetical protein
LNHGAAIDDDDSELVKSKYESPRISPQS